MVIQQSMELRDLTSQRRFRRSHIGVLLEKRIQRPFQRPAATAGFDQFMADPAHSPIAHALPNDTGEYVSHEALIKRSRIYSHAGILLVQTAQARDPLTEIGLTADNSASKVGHTLRNTKENGE